MLKAWCLAGAGISRRALASDRKGPPGHKEVEPEIFLSFFTDAELDLALPPAGTSVADWTSGNLAPNHVRDSLVAEAQVSISDMGGPTPTAMSPVQAAAAAAPPTDTA